MPPSASSNVYDGSWDWERIYRDCHAAEHVGRSVARLLGPARERVVFAGFPVAAEELGRLRPVTFVDRAANVVAAARARFGSRVEPVTADLFEHLIRDAARHVVIACRVSAFWDSEDHFERLEAALLAFPRKRVVIDFFDADRISVGQVLTFGRPPTSGSWQVLSRQGRAGSTTLAIDRVAQRIAYHLDEQAFSYDVERSFFQAADIARWAAHRLPTFHAVIEPPLIPDDPSFTLALRDAR